MSEERIDHMKYLPQMENIGSEIQDKVISEMENYDPNKYTANDVLEALKHDNITPEDFKALLSPAPSFGTDCSKSTGRNQKAFW